MTSLRVVSSWGPAVPPRAPKKMVRIDALYYTIDENHVPQKRYLWSGGHIRGFIFKFGGIWTFSEIRRKNYSSSETAAQNDTM